MAEEKKKGLCSIVPKSKVVCGIIVRQITRRERLEIMDKANSLIDADEKNVQRSINELECFIIKMVTDFEGDPMDLPDVMFSELMEAYKTINELSEAEKKT